MSGNSRHQALIDQLFRDRDAEYRCASKAEQQLKEMTDAKEMKAAYEINEKMNLAYHSLWQNVKKLSGGNQQKIVIAKWMLRDTEIFLLDEPTRGIDIGAKFEIYSLIHELTKQKKAVILVSPEMEELIGLCNRIYVMYEGAILDEVEGERKTQEVIINNLLGVNAE